MFIYTFYSLKNFVLVFHKYISFAIQIIYHILHFK